MATGGSWPPKSDSSSDWTTSSTVGLLIGDGEDDGVSIAGIVDRASLSDSTLILVPASSPSLIILEGVAGDCGEDGITSSCRVVRRLMVTRLDVGGCSEASRVGVEGVGLGSASALGLPSFCSNSSGTISKSLAVSTDLLRDPARDTLWRFREVCSVTSSKGFGRPEQGSEEIERSPLGISSIWQIRKKVNSMGVFDGQAGAPQLKTPGSSHEG
jgi:hypothetical protein